MAKPAEKEPKDMVHQLAIDRETIRKELRTQKLNTTFNINPRTKFHCITGKPNVRDIDMEGEKDRNLAKILWRNFLEPRMKYTCPQTEAQEVGWITTPLRLGYWPEFSNCSCPAAASEYGKYGTQYYIRSREFQLQIDTDIKDRRLNFHRRSNEITKFMAKSSQHK